MPNAWGTNMRVAAPTAFTPTGDISCTAGAATTVITSGAITFTEPGEYYPLLELWLTILFGATAPSAMVLQFIIGAGAAVDSFTVAPATLVNAATAQYGVPLVGVTSGTAWVGSGSTINIQVNPTGQAVTCKQVGSRAIINFQRG